MVEPIDDMPAGTLGFRSNGDLTDADFHEVIQPALEQAAAAGEVRLLLVAPSGFGGADVKAAAERIRSLTNLGHRRDWKRIAVVTDSSWLRRSSRLWTRMVPVETKLFDPSDEPRARRWVAEP